MTPIFSSSFYSLIVTFIFIFENSQNSCGSPFRPFWSVKYLNFGQKLPIQSTHHIFLESRHPEVTKNPYYVLSPEWSQKKDISLRTKLNKYPAKQGTYLRPSSY